MLRYKTLLNNALDPAADTPLTLRELARKTGIPVPSIHNYVEFDTLPRIENIKKLADYFGESVSSLFSEDDDTTTQLVATIRQLSVAQQKALLQDLN